MLDAQRYRGLKHQEEVAFTRKWMWAHMVLGAVVPALFLFHAVFDWSGWAALWYTATLLVMYGFMLEKQACRLMLALLFLGGAAAGVFYINRIFPYAPKTEMTLLPHGFIPIWLGFACLAYVVHACVLLFNESIRKAGRVGFSLW